MIPPRIGPKGERLYRPGRRNPFSGWWKIKVGVAFVFLDFNFLRFSRVAEKKRITLPPKL
jgi:hypothetical protein